MNKVEIKLFGRPSLVVDGEIQPLPEKAFVLLAILVAAESSSASRGQIRSILWGDFDREKANANLRQLIARIHKVEQKFGTRLLQLSGDSIGIDAGASTTDYGEFLALLGGSDGACDAGARCERLLRLWTGPLLEGISFDERTADEWLDRSRESARQRFIDVSRAVLESAFDPLAPEKTEKTENTQRLALKILEIDSTEEAAYRALMRVYAARGDRGLALRIFDRSKRILAAELGVRPNKQTMDLAASLRHREPPQADTPFTRQAANQGGNSAAWSAATGAPRQIPAVMVLQPSGVIADETARGLARGFVEDITVGLTRFRRFAVVASPSGASGAQDDPNQREALAILDVDYTVTVSLMPASHGHRVAIRLTDTSNAEVLWATNTSFTLATLGDTFERVIALVVRTLVDIIDAYQLRMKIPAAEFTAYRHYLEGRRLLYKTDLQGIRRARKMFRQAIGLVADYSAAMIGLSRTMSEEWLVRGMVEDDLLKESIALANRASALDPLDGRALRERGCANLYLRRHEESLESFEQALRLNPNDADILSDYADALAHSGNPQLGLSLCRQAIELNPIPPDDCLWTLGSILYQLGDYRAAFESLRQLANSPAAARLLAACTAQLGEMELARRYNRTVRRVYPEFQVENVHDIVPNLDRMDNEHLIDGLRLAGLA